MTRGSRKANLGISDWAKIRSEDKNKKKRPNSMIYHKLWSDTITDEEIRNILDEYELTSTAYNCIIENKNASMAIKADINYLFHLKVLFPV